MKHKKRLKAPQTLLRNAQRAIMNGEHLQGFKFDDSVYNFKRKELVVPLMRYTEYNIIVDTLVKGARTFIQNTIKNRSHEFEDIIPRHLIHDIFSMYFKDNKDIVLLGYNKTKRVLLSRVVDQMLKIVTEENYLASFFFTKEICLYLWAMIESLSPEDRTKLLTALFQDPDNPISEDDMTEANAILEYNMDNSVSGLKNAIRKAEDQSEEVAKLGKGSGKQVADIKYGNDFEILINKLKNISMSASQINKFFAKLLTHSLNYFSKQVKNEEISLLESDEADVLLDIEYLLPNLKRIYLSELAVENKIERGKFDLYIDVSGSMGVDMLRNSPIIVAKAIALKLKKLGYTNDIYFFSTRLSPPQKTAFDILSYIDGGGTDFGVVLDKCNNTNKNSVILTDCDNSNLKHYNKKVFWIGVNGADFRVFRRLSTGTKYLKNKQCVVYDNNNLKYVTYV